LLEPQSACQLDLYPCAAAAAVTDVALMNGRIAVASEPRIDASRGDRCTHSHFQSVIQSTEQCLRLGPTASVDRNDLIAACKERKTLRLIEAVTRQMERGIAA
jgi:hypothetical protein